MYITTCYLRNIISCNHLVSRMTQYDECRLQMYCNGRNAQRSVAADIKRKTQYATLDKHVNHIWYRVISCHVMVSQRKRKISGIIR